MSWHRWKAWWLPNCPVRRDIACYVSTERIGRRAKKGKKGYDEFRVSPLPFGSSVLVIRGLRSVLRRAQSFSWLSWFGSNRGYRRSCHCRSLANLDPLVLVIDHDVRSAIAHTPAGTRFVFLIVDLQLGKVRLNFAIPNAGIDTETGLIRQSKLNRSVTIVDLHVSHGAHRQLNRAIIVL